MIDLLYRMQDDRFLETTLLLASDFHQQLCLQQFLHGVIDDLLRNLRHLMDIFRRKCLLTIIEAMTHLMHHHSTDLDTLFQLHMIILQVQIIMMQVLVGIAEQGTEHYDCPRNLEPQEEQWNGGKRTIDYVIARKEYLQINISILQCRHADARQKRRHQRTAKPDIGIRYHAIAEHEE